MATTAATTAGTAAPGAREIAARVRAGEMHPIEVVRGFLERIRALDGELGAFTVVREKEALGEAEALAGRDDLGSLPLAGVPVAGKENMAVTGLPTLQGSRA